MPLGTGHTGSRREAPLGGVAGHRRAFTIVELAVCSGIILVLTALIAPAIGGSMERARLTRAMSQARQNAALVSLYAADHDDVYPIARDNPESAGFYWHEALIPGGYLAEEREADPEGWRRTGNVLIYLSMCMVYDPRFMVPERTLPIAEARSSPVRQAQVLYPSQKGMMVRLYEGPRDYDSAWCCLSSQNRAPVAMADGSALSGLWHEFMDGRPFMVENQIGVPVFSTWGGYLGRDR